MLIKRFIPKWMYHFTENIFYRCALVTPDGRAWLATWPSVHTTVGESWSEATVTWSDTDVCVLLAIGETIADRRLNSATGRLLTFLREVSSHRVPPATAPLSGRTPSTF